MDECSENGRWMSWRAACAGRRAAITLWAVGLLLLIAVACVADDAPRAECEHGEGTASTVRTVVWLSIDGVRPDYVDRAETPFLDELMKQGAFSRALVPVFPSLTFPGHVSQATGVKVKHHGVPSNSFIDRTDWRVHRYPWDSRLLEAEPIWNTATRQGIRTAVYDWPLSHAQKGEHAAAFHSPRYIRGMSDQERLDTLLDAWARDQAERREENSDQSPLRLLMGYGVGPDALGHRYGPEAEPPAKKMQEIDSMLQAMMDRIIALWDGQRQPDEELYLILTTDHGMSEVHTLVNLVYLAGLTEESPVEAMTSGNIGHLFLRDGLSAEEQAAKVKSLIERAGQPAFARAWRRDDLLQRWQYDHPSRTGDVVVVLKTGYTFSGRPDGVAGPAKVLGGPLGMHGYCPRENPEMNGLMVIHRHPKPLGGVHLGSVHSLQLHATVAQLLGIEPAENARADGIEFASD